MAEEGSRLAKAIVGLFKEFYIGYLSADLDLHKNDMDSICTYYNNIARLLNGRDYTNSEGKAIAIEIDDERICDFQTKLDKLSSVERKLFLRNLLDFIKAYKLYALKDILKYIEDIAGDFEHIAEKINNAEKYSAYLISAVSKGHGIYKKLKKLRRAYVKGTFSKDAQGMRLLDKTVKELGIIDKYGEVMINIDIGLYCKRMSFDNPDLVTKGAFSSWEKLKKYVDDKCKKEVKITNNEPFDTLKSLKEFVEDINNVGCNEIKWDNKTFEDYETFEKAFFEKIFTDTEFLKENQISEITENDKNLMKELCLMDRPHAHHVFYKNWENRKIWKWSNESDDDKESNKDLDEKIKKARNILWEYEINPYVGVENLCWAPNVNPDQHNDEHIRIIAEKLISFYNEKAPREKIIKYLNVMKKKAKNLWK